MRRIVDIKKDFFDSINRNSAMFEFDEIKILNMPYIIEGIKLE